MGLDYKHISASMGLGEFGVVPQLPTMCPASARREQLTSPATLGKGLRKLKTRLLTPGR